MKSFDLNDIDRCLEELHYLKNKLKKEAVSSLDTKLVDCLKNAAEIIEYLKNATNKVC